MRKIQAKSSRKLDVLPLLTLQIIPIACKPVHSADVTAAQTPPSTTSQPNADNFAALSEAERSLSKCEYYLRYGYSSHDSHSYSATRAGIFPQSPDFNRTSIELWHSRFSDLSASAHKCNVKIPYNERVSVIYSEYSKSHCVADFFKMNNQNVIRISSKHDGSHIFNGVVQPDSKIHFLVANSISSLEDFFVWFAKNGAAHCKKKAGWLSPIGKIEDTLNEIVNHPVSYDKFSGHRSEILPERRTSLGNMLAYKFLTTLTREIKFKPVSR